MSRVAMSETAFLGGLAFWAEMGREVDDGASGMVTVGQNVKPANDIANNMDQLSCLRGVRFEPKVKTVGTKNCFYGVNYNEEDVKRVVEDVVVFTSDDMDELVHRLQFGLSAAVEVGGAEVNAFASSDRKIYGWLKLQAHRPGSGENLLTVDMWGYLELGTPVEWQDGISQPTLRFVHKGGSSLGTPIVFPSAA